MTTPTTPARNDDSPAVALGPLALILGAVSTVGAWPTIWFVGFPWTFLAGCFAVTFGAMGIHYARQGTGRLWTATAGAVLGGAGLGVYLTLLMAYAA
ncbi:hypothetical protein [Streptomyces sp. NPDC058755]|uniref:hypothetical protein n=1 Tax=unclassified Streptomyces TaxID=2593676 RepID=UPI0036A2DDBE